MSEEVRYSRDPAEDDPWKAAAKELAPDKSLTRVGANARATVTTVTVVGTALTALGLVTTQTLVSDRTTRTLALLSIGAALLAVLFALLYLALRIDEVNSENFLQVKRWYKEQFRRTWLAVAASWLLIPAVILGGAAGLRSALASGKEHAPQLMLGVAGVGGERTVTASATVTRLRAGALVTVRLMGEPANASPVLLAQSSITPGETGTATVAPGATKVPAYTRYRLVVFVGDQERASMSVPISGR